MEVHALQSILDVYIFTLIIIWLAGWLANFYQPVAMPLTPVYWKAHTGLSIGGN